MPNQSIRIIANGLKPLTDHTIKVGDITIPMANVQVTGSTLGGANSLTSTASGGLDFTVYADTADGKTADRTVVVSAPFSSAAAQFTF